VPARRKPVSVSVVEAKKSLSELLGRVAYGQETITIQKRGKPMARLVPVEPLPKRHPAEIKGWLDDDDPFFQYIDEIVKNRHMPRCLTPQKD
jgi:prevent-host-death family protein